jgi:hypothetical protein
MTPLEEIAPAFVEMAHSIVWASVATADCSAQWFFDDETRIAVWDGAVAIGG